MKHTILYLLAAVALLGFSACKDDEPEPMVSITILKSDVLFKSDGGTGTVEFACETTPTAVCDMSWCHPTVAAGVLSVTVDPNTDYDTRMATVTLSTGQVKKDIYVQQDGLAIHFSYPTTSYNVTNIPSTINVKAFATDPVSITCDADWLTAEKTEEGLKLNVKSNYGGDKRVAHVTVSAPQHDNEAVITVTQWEPPVEGTYTMGFYKSSSLASHVSGPVMLTRAETPNEYMLTCYDPSWWDEPTMLMLDPTWAIPVVKDEKNQQFIIKNGSAVGTWNNYYCFSIINYHKSSSAYTNYTKSSKYDIYLDYTVEPDATFSKNSRYHLTMRDTGSKIGSSYVVDGFGINAYKKNSFASANNAGYIVTLCQPTLDKQ